MLKLDINEILAKNLKAGQKVRICMKDQFSVKYKHNGKNTTIRAILEDEGTFYILLNVDKGANCWETTEFILL